MFSTSHDSGYFTLTNTVTAVGLASTLAIATYYLRDWFTHPPLSLSELPSRDTGASSDTLRRLVKIASTVGDGVLGIHAHGYHDPWTETESRRTEELISKLQKSYSSRRWPWQRALKGDDLKRSIVKEFRDEKIFLADTEIEEGPLVATASDLQEYRDLFPQKTVALDQEDLRTLPQLRSIDQSTIESKRLQCCRYKENCTLRDQRLSPDSDGVTGRCTFTDSVVYAHDQESRFNLLCSLTGI